MITTSDFIVKLIYEQGYKSGNDFAVKNNLNAVLFLECIRKNTWTKEMLEKVGKAFGKDLSKFVTTQFGRIKGTRCKFE